MMPSGMPYCSRDNIAKWIALFVIVACCPWTGAQEAPIEAQLSQTLAGNKLKVGSSFALQVLAPWEQADCRLASGALLHAAVESVAASNGHTRGITFVVRIPCGERKPLEPVVISLLAAPRMEEETVEVPGFAIPSGVNQPRPSTATLNPMDASKPAPLTIRNTKKAQLPESVTLGEVWHLSHIRLVLPAADSTESSITTDKPSLVLPARTIFILQVVRQRSQSPRALPVVASHVIREEPRSAAPFIGLCRGGQCTLDPTPFSTSPFGVHRAGDAEDLSRFGLRSESDREVLQLQQSTSVHFLSDAEVLVTFPTHELMRHSADERPTDDPQQVRALLFNIATRSADRMESWMIDDHNAYVWSLGRNLLIHGGRCLRLYGPGLQEIASLALDGPLAFLRTSPDGQHVLIGELRELHSREDHLMLVDTLARGPQEEVRWSLLDQDLHRIRTVGTSSNFVPAPVLLDDGIIELRKGVGPEWFLVAKAWDSSNYRQLGTLHSACLPVLESVSPDLLAATTCDTSGKERHTTLVRKNGAPAVEQTSTLKDLPASVTGSGTSNRFALMLSQVDKDWDQGRLFRFSMIRAQRIEVFAGENGSLLASLPLPGEDHSSNAFALSPDGHTLAFVAGHHLSFYQLSP
jgi:hypothetical protein